MGTRILSLVTSAIILLAWSAQADFLFPYEREQAESAETRTPPSFRLEEELFRPQVKLSLQGQKFTIQFNQEIYEVRPDETFPVQVLISPAPSGGLFSYGVRLTFDSVLSQAGNPSSILLPAELNFNGVEGAGAVRATGNGFAAVKGTVNVFPPPAQAYNGSLLATFNISNLSKLGTYQLNASIFNTLGATEDVFVSGDGVKLDSMLVFGSATVNIIPEPGTLGLLGLGVLTLLWRRMRMGA